MVYVEKKCSKFEVFWLAMVEKKSLHISQRFPWHFLSDMYSSHWNYLDLQNSTEPKITLLYFHSNDHDHFCTKSSVLVPALVLSVVLKKLWSNSSCILGCVTLATIFVSLYLKVLYLQIRVNTRYYKVTNIKYVLVG